ncbi:MAG: hypothetical protein KDI68_03600 [Gammaproteobacteria bacterium]|nr:hypothetical protein [Gammaproteobacteria bacterium]
MKRLIMATLLVPSLVLPAFVVSAHSTFDRIEDRLERQQQRIEQGVASGELTRKETKQLNQEQRRLHRKLNKFSRDGILSAKERRKMMARLDRASEHIYSLKHNVSSRPRIRTEKRRERHWVRDDRRWSQTRSDWPRYGQR